MQLLVVHRHIGKFCVGLTNNVFILNFLCKIIYEESSKTQLVFSSYCFEEGFLPGDKHSSVMVSDPVVWDGVTVAAPVLDVFLPLTEAV